MYCISRMDSTLARMIREGPRHDGDGDRDDHVVDGRAQCGRHHEGQHQQRQPLEDVEQPLGDEIRLAAGVAREQSDDAAQHRAQQGGAQAHHERHAGAVHEPRVHVAAQMIGAEPVLLARLDQRGGGLRGDGVVGRELIGEHRGERHDEQEQPAEGPQRLAAREAEDRGRPRRIAHRRGRRGKLQLGGTGLTAMARRRSAWVPGRGQLA